MTREEAINILSWMPENFNMLGAGCVGEREAIKMSIEALKADDLVRCKECKRYESDGGALMTCTLHDLIVDDDCFCWWGERQEE